MIFLCKIEENPTTSKDIVALLGMHISHVGQIKMQKYISMPSRIANRICIFFIWSEFFQHNKILRDTDFFGT